MRYKKPFSISKRRLKSGKIIYYYQTYDENGKRTATRSTGQTTKSAAETWVLKHYKNGTLIIKKKHTLKEYAAPFWIWETCPYIKAKLKRGGKITKGYAESQRRCLDLHILPVLGKYSLSDITPHKIEKFMFNMKDKGFAAITINHCIKALKVVFTEAEKEKIIQENPIEKIKPLIGESKSKSILTPDEVKKLFSLPWGDHMHYTINLIAASTGMRMGEIQALKRKYVHPEYLEVYYSWGRKHGLKETKTYNKRVIPIPSRVSNHLFKHIQENNIENEQDFIFYFSDPGIPIDHKQIIKELYKAFEKIGITPEIRKRKNYTFHSWRYFFNTYCRSRGVPDSKLRRITGHKTLKMTEHYTAFKLEDFREVVDVQEEIFTGG